MDIIMKLSLSFFSLSSLAAVALAAPALGSPKYLSDDDGTYKTSVVTSVEDCKALCGADPQNCRGTIVVQMDISKSEFICRLNNGKGTQPAFPSSPPQPLDMDTALSDFNDYRASKGLTSVSFNPHLNTASQVHAKDMAKLDEATHYGSDGSSHSDRIQRQGYYFSLAAENVASGQKSWKKVFQAWQESPGHNENLLLPDVTEFGVALVYDPDTTYQTYWAMLVARPLPQDIQDVMRTEGLNN